MDLIYTKPKSEKTLKAQLRAYSDLSAEEAQRMASQAFHGGATLGVPIAKKSEWPKVGKKEKRVIEYRIHRILRAINEAYPLLKDEEMGEKGYFASYLVDDFLDYPKGTVAVRRKSSFGELVFISPDFVVQQVEIVTARARPQAPEPMDASAFAIPWGTLALNLAKSLASTLGSQIGGAIFAEFFPPTVPSYFDEVYKQFERIVQGVIDEVKRRELSGKVASIQDKMATYNVIKKDPSKFKESQDILSAVWNDSVQVTNELKAFPEIGLALFVIAGTLHLAILQERALTDQSHADPNNSPWAEELIRKANEFAPFAVENRNKIISTRANAISQVKFVQKSDYIPPAGPVDASYWVWQDTFVGEVHKYPKRQGCCDPDPESTAHNDRQARWDSTVGVMTTELSAVIPSAEEWRKVSANPIPQLTA